MGKKTKLSLKEKQRDVFLLVSVSFFFFFYVGSETSIKTEKLPHLRPADSVGDEGLVHVLLGWRHRAGPSLALWGGHRLCSHNTKEEEDELMKRMTVKNLTLTNFPI